MISGERNTWLPYNMYCTFTSIFRVLYMIPRKGHPFPILQGKRESITVKVQGLEDSLEGNDVLIGSLHSRYLGDTQGLMKIKM